MINLMAATTLMICISQSGYFSHKCFRDIWYDDMSYLSHMGLFKTCVSYCQLAMGAVSQTGRHLLKKKIFDNF
jgi:hypothetical protein